MVLRKNQEYKCTRCGRGAADGIGRDNLLVKRVQFTTMGASARIVRSRVQHWLCPDCVLKDDDWKLPKSSTSVLDKEEIVAKTG